MALLIMLTWMGEGFPLVLLHGFTGDSKTWKPFLQNGEKVERLIAIDIIGHGQSDSPKDSKRYEMLSVAKDIKQILEILKIEKTDILGYSMGGRLALSFAIQYPLFVRKLVLESSSPGLITEQEEQTVGCKIGNYVISFRKTESKSLLSIGRISRFFHPKGVFLYISKKKLENNVFKIRL